MQEKYRFHPGRELPKDNNNLEKAGINNNNDTAHARMHARTTTCEEALRNRVAHGRPSSRVSRLPFPSLPFCFCDVARSRHCAGHAGLTGWLAGWLAGCQMGFLLLVSPFPGKGKIEKCFCKRRKRDTDRYMVYLLYVIIRTDVSMM